MLAVMLLVAVTTWAEPRGEAGAADGMTLTAVFDATKLYVDQPVRMTVTWRSRTPFRQCWALQMELPLLRDPHWDVFPIAPEAPEKQRVGLPVSGQRVIGVKAKNATGEQIQFAYMLIPRRAGNAPEQPAQLRCALMKGKQADSRYPSYFDNHFFRTPETNDVF